MAIQKDLQKYTNDAHEIIEELNKTANSEQVVRTNTDRFVTFVCALIDELTLYSSVKECLSLLIFDLIEIRDIWKEINGKSYREIFGAVNEARELMEDYNKAVNHLKKAAGLLSLPENYYLEKVTEKGVRRITMDEMSLLREDVSNRKIIEVNGEKLEETSITLRNCSKEGVPRFEGESDEFYNRRLSPNNRIKELSTNYILYFGNTYGSSGGGREDNLPAARFRSAVIWRIAGHVPSGINHHYAFIEDLMIDIGISLDKRDVRSKIESVARDIAKRRFNRENNTKNDELWNRLEYKKPKIDDEINKELGKLIRIHKRKDDLSKCRVLMRIKKKVPWNELEESINPHIDEKDSEWNRMHSMDMMLKIYCVQRLYRLSDREMVRALPSVRSIRYFVAGKTKMDNWPSMEMIKDFREQMNNAPDTEELMTRVYYEQDQAIDKKTAKRRRIEEFGHFVYGHREKLLAKLQNILLKLGS